MRLLNTHHLRLKSFTGAEAEIPPYAILSHTWEGVEITLEDIRKRPLAELQSRPAFAKVDLSCRQAKHDGFDWIWIDTCCIDRSSSEDVSEAVNSMFKWYQQSSVCYVWLSDTPFSLPQGTHADRTSILPPDNKSFLTCRWFTRGWTLQELIAPRRVEFFDRNWVRFGSRDSSLRARICERTRICAELLTEPRCACLKASRSLFVRDGRCQKCSELDRLPQTLDSYNAAIKMSWASLRATSRKEDVAYCLLGLFNISMPLLYGEGDRAFLRLQEAIFRQSKDQSILLWRAHMDKLPSGQAPGCLSPKKEFFRSAVPVIARQASQTIDYRFETDFRGNLAPIELTDTALTTTLWMCPCILNAYNVQSDSFMENQLWLGILDLAHDNDYLSRPSIILEHMTADLYRRVYHEIIFPVDPRLQNSTVSINLKGRSHAVEALAHHSTITNAVKKNIGILLQQSPINAVAKQSALDGGPPTGPVYETYVYNDCIRCKLDLVGSYPLLNSYDRAAQMTVPWEWEKCQHSGAERLIGGLHFFKLTLKVEKKRRFRKVGFVIIWGMHRQSEPEGVEPVEEASSWALTVHGTQPPSADSRSWKPWCRIFFTDPFMKHAQTSTADLHPSELSGDEALSGREIQQRIEDQRRRLGLQGYESCWIQEEDGPKRLFPDSCGDEWAADDLQNVTWKEYLNLSAKVSRVEGLGRTLYELEVEIHDPHPDTT